MKISVDIHPIASRLKEERERLGMTQPVFAEAASAKKRTLIDWEKGVSSPTAVQLAALATIGVDVAYVLTGSRSFKPEPAITPEQRMLIADFEACSPSDQAALRRTAAAMALGMAAGTATPGKSKQVFHGEVGQAVSGNITNQKAVTFNVGGKKK
ncbi:helix-turn-helix transcriptional regulator [Achromobacter xylosoxidans]|jgi:transcriptional regulator with XRE-family HTH domain|uniref:Helix-turn-helix transcriptional regulator n=1 Tax=Alcaligenes xylosoxydans xylosoxydans TaxID=85698 RepID=A0A9W5ACU8_ALCXX|nr:helix-turn-helix transcriptional regulator [Achromobacter xylosoxidans]MCZ8403179.1 helix-turn-helix transcriptional regulator [Achromobacter xylosoxidans]CUI71400.1 transcriptional repressor DicA [Achromobacter xylosoxidans]